MPLPLSLELAALLRMVLGLAVLLYLWPRYAMAAPGGIPRGDLAVGNAGRMLLWLILGGYLITALHLYSGAGLALVLLAIRLVRQPTPANSLQRGNRGSQLLAGLLADLDHLGSWPGRIAASLGDRWPLTRPALASLRPYGILAAGLALLVLGVSAWLRLASPLAHASIPYSDSDVTLFWSKAINQQLLFPNGVYPYGFYLVLAALMRLTGSAPIITAKFFVPFIGIAMVASVGYATYRLSGRTLPAILAMLLYGTLPHLLPYNYLRQVGIDEQELGTALVLPTLWFTYMSWVQSGAWYRGTALALLAVEGLTHPVGAIDAVAAALAATLAAWLTTRVRWDQLSWYLRWTPIAALASLLPFAIPLALGMHLDTAGSAFAVRANLQAAPAIGPVDETALGAVIIFVLVRLVRLADGRATRTELGMAVAALITYALALGLREAPIFGIHSAVLVSRSGEFAALAEALCFGLGLSALQEFLELVRPAFGRWTAMTLSLVLMVAAWASIPLAPFDAFTSYRWLPDDFVVAYVRIAQSLPSGTWLAVSDDSGFDYAYGQGLFMTAEDLSAHVGTTGRWPDYHHPGQPAVPLAASHLFIFVDRRVVVAPAYRRVVLPRRRAAQRLIRRWVAAWRETHGPLRTYFRGPDLTVYELTAPTAASH